jgi:hypothetical protein
MITTVVNCRFQEYDVYIGRPSKWGNPFAIGRDGTREDVINKYIDWLSNQQDLLSNLHQLHGKRLGCYCSPASCHGDILAELCNHVFGSDSPT